MTVALMHLAIAHPSILPFYVHRWYWHECVTTGTVPLPMVHSHVVRQARASPIHGAGFIAEPAALWDERVSGRLVKRGRGT